MPSNSSASFSDVSGIVQRNSSSNGQQSDQNGSATKGQTNGGGKMERLQFRSLSPGYWTLMLMPVAIFFADQKFLHQSFPAVMIITYNSTLLLFLHLFSGGDQSMKEYLEYLKGFNFIMGVLATLYGYSAHGDGPNPNIVYEYALWAGLTFSFPYVFLNLIVHYPRSFSFGEGVIVTSAFVYNYWTTFHNIIVSKFSDVQNADDPILITLFQELSFLGTILAARGVLFFMRPQKFFALQEMYTLCTKAAFANFLGKLSSPVDDLWFLFKWIVLYLIGNSQHVALLGVWSFLVVGAIVFVLNSVGEATTTVDRKFFHILMCFVYLPAVLNDLNFIFFCSTVVLYFMIVLEAIRVLRFEIWGYRVGEFISNGVVNFRDNRDSGPLLLTPIYLLAGCSGPIWLTGLYLESKTNYDLTPEELAAAITGILSVGIGDTVASVVGTLYGQLHWPGSKKTVEGTVCSMLAQIFTVLVLCYAGYLPYTTVSLIALCISAVVNSVTEALTTQIDNLVVPLVAFISVHAVIYASDFFLV